MDKDYVIDYCYHTHTYRCGHALGKDEDYVIKAIECGIKELAFTDHIPFPNFSQPGVRMEFSQIDEYLKSIRDLRDKYADKIKIYVGFEAEYMPQYLSYYRSLFTDYHIDLLILGQHGKIIDGQFVFYTKRPHDIEFVQDYVDSCKAALRTGLFSYFAHPDLFLSAYMDNDSRFVSWSKDLIKCSVENDVPMEINCGGLSPLNSFNKGVDIHYPYLPFFKMVAKKKGNKVFIGYDAHSIQTLGGPEDIKQACLNIANESKVNLLSRLQMKKVN